MGEAMNANNFVLTKVFSTLVDHLAIHLPEPIASIDELVGVRDDLILVLGADILYKVFSGLSIKAGQAGTGSLED